MPEPHLDGSIRWGSVASLVLTSLAIMGSPGPSTISLVAAGGLYGRRGALRYLTGLVLGSTVVLIAVATGVTAALLAVPALGPVLLGISAAYILWLAYHIATTPPLSEVSTASRRPSFAGGLLLGISNPKAWIAIAAVFAGTRLATGSTTNAAAKLAVLTLMIVIIHAAWLLAGTSLVPLLHDPRRARALNAGLAAALIFTTAFALFH